VQMGGRAQKNWESMRKLNEFTVPGIGDVLESSLPCNENLGK